MLGTHPIVRFLNQNRREIRNVILVIIAFFLLLRLLNYMAEEKEEKETIEENRIQSELKLSNNRKELIENFLEFCKSGDESSAYALLSSECKENSFQSLNKFKTNYVEKYFSSDKTYSIKYSTSSNKKYYYTVKIFEDMLSTGKVNSGSVTQSFILVQEEGKEKITIEIN